MSRWLLSGLLLTFALPGYAAAPPSPRPWLQSQIERAEQLAQRPVDTPEEEQQWRDDAKAMVNDVVHWDRMIRKSYPKQWDELSPTQRNEFTRLLRRLIEASYQSKLKMALREKGRAKTEGFDIEWLDEKVKGDQGELEASIRTDQRVVFLKFKLIRDGDQWKVWDVAPDGASTVRTYRSQFRSIMKDEGGWDGLITRLEKKLADVEAGRGEFIVSDGG
jgi:phospholipid transport system substrate-binding protein